MRPLTDTSKEAEQVLIEGYRRMSPARKLMRVFDLTEALNQMARARILEKWGPDLSEREVKLRLAALRLDRQTMISVFGFDPEEMGY